MGSNEVTDLYSAVVTGKWGEAYSLFQELERAGKREFYTQNVDSTTEVYCEMMDSACEALGIEPEYDDSMEEVTNAFIYSANEDYGFGEFRDAAVKIIEEDRKWLDYAEQSV